MSLTSLKADTKLARERILEAKYEGLPDEVAKVVRDELAQNLWPWLEAFCEEVDAELGDLNEGLDQLIDQNDSILQPEVAAQFVSLLELAKLYIKETKDLVGDLDDEVRRKRLRDLAKATLQQYEISIETIKDITVDVDVEPVEKESGGDDDDGEGGQDESEDEDGDEDQDEDDTPVETPRRKKSKPEQSDDIEQEG